MMGSKANLLLLSFALALPGIAQSNEYQPLSITVNENFNNNQLDEIIHTTSSLAPNFSHQGANFYFNPTLHIPSEDLPPHVAALFASSFQKNKHILIEEKQPKIEIEVVEKAESLKPIKGSPVLDIKEDMIDIIKIEIPKPIELPTPGLDILLDGGEITGTNVPLTTIEVSEDIKELNTFKKTPIIKLPEPQAELTLPTPIEIVNKESFGASSLQSHKNGYLIEGYEVPVVPHFQYDFSHPFIKKEENEESAHELIARQPQFYNFKPIEVIKGENIASIPVPVPSDSKANLQQLARISEAPILRPLSINFLVPIITEELSKLPIPENIDDQVKIKVDDEIKEDSAENIDITNELSTHSKTVESIQEIVAIPNAPVLPPLSIDVTPAVVVGEVNARPTEVDIPISGLEKVNVIDISSLPPSKPEAFIQELAAIPDAPELPPLAINISEVIEKVNETPEPFVFPAEISISDQVQIADVENMGMISFPIPSPIYNEPTAIIQESVAIPDAPVLPQLSIDIPSSVVTEELNNISVPKSIELLTESTNCQSELPTMPDAPILPPLAIDIPASFVVEEVKDLTDLKPIEFLAELPVSTQMKIEEVEKNGIQSTINQETKAVIKEIVAMPNAPILPSFTLNMPPPFIINEEEEADIIPVLESIEDVMVKDLSASEIRVKDEPDSFMPELIALPEAPRLPPLSMDISVPSIIEEANEISVEGPIELTDSYVVPSIPIYLSTYEKYLERFRQKPETTVLSSIEPQPVITDIVEIPMPEPIKISTKFSIDEPTEVLVEEDITIPFATDVTAKAMYPEETVVILPPMLNTQKRQMQYVEPELKEYIIMKEILQRKPNTIDTALEPLPKLAKIQKHKKGKEGDSSTSCVKNIVAEQISPYIMMRVQSP